MTDAATRKSPNAHKANKLSLLAILFDCGLLLLVLGFTTPTIAVVGFLFGFSISRFHFVIAFFLSFCVIAYKSSYSVASKGLSGAVALLVIIGSLFFSASVYDMSYDGMHYHLTAVIELIRGWNPILEPLPEDFTNMIVDAFAGKGVWYFSASIAKLTQTINTSKAYHFIGGMAAFFIGLYTLSYGATKKRKWVTVVVCVILLLNPVFLYQFCSNYTDAYMGNLWLCLFYAFLLVENHGKLLTSWRPMLICITVIGIICNIKFTGIFFAGVFYFFFWIRASWPMIQNKKWRRIIKNATPGIVGLVAALFIGINPYITNVLRGRHMFFPMLGDGKIDLMGDNVPPIIRGTPGVYKLFYGIFSGANGDLKFPLQFDTDDLALGYDQRLGGFGPLFSACFILAVVFFAIVLIGWWKKQLSTVGQSYLYLCVVIIVVALIFPEAWWPRYYPILWAFPLFGALALMEINPHGWALRVSCGLLGLIMVVNVGLVAASTQLYLLVRPRTLGRALDYIKNKPVVAYNVDEYLFSRYFYYILEEKNVTIIEEKEAALENPFYADIFQLEEAE